MNYLFKGGPCDYGATSVHVCLSHRLGDVLRAVVLVVNVASYILQKHIVFTFRNLVMRSPDEPPLRVPRALIFSYPIRSYSGARL